MKYHVEEVDLFSVSDEYYLAHCISADFMLGKGIALEFNKRFNMKQKLYNQCPNYLINYQKFKNTIYHTSDCIMVDRVFNLVTKERYYHKPTYKSLTNSLETMRDICFQYNIKKIAMPTIGCGLDKLEWNKVSMIIKNIFETTDIEILICIKK